MPGRSVVNSLRNPLPHKGHDIGFGGYPALNGWPFLERLELGIERNNLDLQRVALDLEAVNNIVPLAQLDELAGARSLDLLEAQLEAARGHGVFRAQEVLVGLNFHHRLRERALQAPHG